MASGRLCKQRPVFLFNYFVFISFTKNLVMQNCLRFFTILLLLLSCREPSQIPAIGFLDIAEDETLAKARTGFFDALKAGGYSEEQGTLHIYHANAQGDIAMLTQSCDYLLSKKIDLLATNATLPTITAVQRSQSMPVCMMVSPRPDLAGLTTKQGIAPKNLFGVYETLDYIDTAVSIIKLFFPEAKTIGTIYNSSEPQSRNALAELQKAATMYKLNVISLPVSNSSETQLVTKSLLAKSPDVFFALPDNVIFASFETVAQSCSIEKVPIFTSEAGLVSRGALASFGADFYLWGKQAGEEALQYLKNKNAPLPVSKIVKARKYVFNSNVALKFNILKPENFQESE
jgi:putative ABC transport system substrate-binding protein